MISRQTAERAECLVGGLEYGYEGRNHFVRFISCGAEEVGSATCDVGHVPAVDVGEAVATGGAPEAVGVPGEDGAGRLGSGVPEPDLGPGGDAEACAAGLKPKKVPNPNLTSTTKRDAKGNPTSWGVIRAQKYELRKLALAMAEKDDVEIRKRLRKKLEVISLLYASKSKDADGFMAASKFAMDVSGIRQEQAARAKLRAAKAEAKAAKKGIRAAREAEMAERPKDVTF